MEKHDDVAVRCGVKLAREYMQYLKDENEKLQEEMIFPEYRYTHSFLQNT